MSIKYLLRVMVHDASRDDYERLHQALENLKIFRCILSDDMRVHWLPDATYMTYSVLEISVLHRLVADVVARTIPRLQPAFVLVVRYDQACWTANAIPKPLPRPRLGMLAGR